MAQHKAAVLLLAHGTPDTPSDIPEFMKHVTGGRQVTNVVMEEVRHRYEVIGKSPLTDITRAQADGVQRELGLPVYVGMRNWRPFIGDAVREMANDGVQEMVGICMAPQSSSTSTGQYRKALTAELRPEINAHFVEAWHDHPLLIQAFAEKLQPVWQRASAELKVAAPVIFTSHSVPTRTIQAGDPYEHQSKETARLVAERISGLQPDLRLFAFQSQGMSGGPWLGPTAESAVLEAKRRGHKGVVIAPVGFVCDHVDVLYDIDITLRSFAATEGMKLWRPESLNTSPTFIAAVAQLAASRLRVPSRA
jgi:ferrochelatase